jgi:hypothetical protein
LFACSRKRSQDRLFDANLVLVAPVVAHAAPVAAPTTPTPTPSLSSSTQLLSLSSGSTLHDRHQSDGDSSCRIEWAPKRFDVDAGFTLALAFTPCDIPSAHATDKAHTHYDNAFGVTCQTDGTQVAVATSRSTESRVSAFSGWEKFFKGHRRSSTKEV